MARIDGPIDGRTCCTREEIGALVVEYLRDLRAFSRSLTKESAAADDLVQEAIVKALTSAHHFERGTNFKAWMFTILRNAFYNQSRLNNRYITVAEPIETAVEEEQDGLLEMADFKRAFWQLNPDHREVLILIGPSGLSYEEVAQVCNCAIGTVKSRTSRARQELRRILESDKTAISRRDVAPAAAILQDQMLALPDWLERLDFHTR